METLYDRARRLRSRGLLWNGIGITPLRETDPERSEPEEIPYLKEPGEGGTHPGTIDITVGRQLFVDRFLIDHTDLKVVRHRPVKYGGNPILTPQTEQELRGESGVTMSCGGVWYDREWGKYRMWYDVAFNPMMGYAESDDGIHWERVKVPGKESNIVLEEAEKNGTCSVFIDYDAPASERYKMYLHSFHHHHTRYPGSYRVPNGSRDENNYAGTLFLSEDGLRWRQIGGLSENLCGDMTTAYYDELRGKWVGSLRGYRDTVWRGQRFNGRARWYCEHDRFEELLHWTPENSPFWLKCDGLDDPDRAVGVPPQMYNFNAIAYESILLGQFQIWRGPENHIAARLRTPKITEVIAAYSRDGFHFDRPDREAFLPAEREDGFWDKGYLFAPIAGVIVGEDEIRFYYSGFSGMLPSGEKSMHAGGAIGMALLRRDGFASMEGKGELLTRKLTVQGDRRFLFVNLDSPAQSLRVEVTDPDGKPIPGFTAADCLPAGGNQTARQIRWQGGEDLSFLKEGVFRLRFFHEKEDCRLYSFWLSPDQSGASGGASAAGFTGKR